MTAIFMFVLLIGSCNNQGPSNSSTLTSDTSKVVTNSWIITFKPNTSAIIKEMALSSIENALMDSIAVAKKNLKGDLKASLSRVQTVSAGDQINYQIKVEFSGENASAYTERPFASLPPPPPPLHVSNNIIARPNDTIIIKYSASALTSKNDTIIIKTLSGYYSGSDPCLNPLNPPCPPPGN